MPMIDIKFEAKTGHTEISTGILGLPVLLAVAKFSDLVRLLTASSW